MKYSEERDRISISLMIFSLIGYYGMSDLLLAVEHASRLHTSSTYNKARLLCRVQAAGVRQPHE